MHINSKMILVFVFAIFLNLFFSGAHAALTCTIAASCPADYVDFFHISDTSNAHAELNSQASYANKVCCMVTSVPGILGTSCSGVYDEILRFSAETNAHVEQYPNTPQYYTAYKACMSATQSVYSVSCNYRTTCNADETCLVSISGGTNAHVAGCSGYSTKVCCKAMETTPPVTTIAPDGKAWWASDIPFTLSCTDQGSGCMKVYYQILNDGQTCSTTESDYTPTSGSSASGTVTCAAEADCKKKICYYSKDIEGNKETTHTSQVFYIDKKQPTISDDYAYDGTWYSGGAPKSVTVTLNPQDTGSGVKIVKWCSVQAGSLACTPTNTLPSPYQLTYNTEQNTDVYYRVWDFVDNSVPSPDGGSSGKYVVKLDFTAPNVQVTGAPTAEWENIAKTATLVCSDPASGGVASSCDPATYRIKTFPNSPPPNDQCYTPGVAGVQYEDYAPYTNPITISNHVWVCVAAKDVAGNLRFSSPVEFRIDTTPPVTTVGQLKGWMNETQFDLNWGVITETESGIDHYVLEYRYWSDSQRKTLERDWATWPSPTTTETTMKFNVFDETKNNRTVEFRVRAVDKAGNAEAVHTTYDTFTKIDIKNPVCSIESFGDFVNLLNSDGGLNVRWSSVEGESGVEYYVITYRVSGDLCTGPRDWSYLNPAKEKWNPGELLYTILQDLLIDNCNYEFKCIVKDVANNSNGAAPFVQTAVTDLSPPTVNFDGVNPDSITGDRRWPWTNKSYFSVSWDGFDGVGSGVKSYTVDWSDDGINYCPLRYGPQCRETKDIAPQELTNAVFDMHCGHCLSGKQGITQVQENVTYYFYVKAKDVAGNVREFFLSGGRRVPQAQITYDNTTPATSVAAYDQNNKPITSKVVSSQFVWKVFLRASSIDRGSGVYTNKIKYDIVEQNVRKVGETDCGQASEWGGESACEITQSYGEDSIIKYSLETQDRAGNTMDTPIFYVVTHPLANFIAHNLQLSLGDTYLMQLQVRNLQDAVDDVVISLSGYPLAKFVNVGYGRISEDGRNLNITLTPDEEKIFHIKILSSEPERERLYIAANSSVDPNLDDEDDAIMIFDYPASFPELNGAAIALLVILSTGVFWYAKRNNSGKWI